MPTKAEIETYKALALAAAAKYGLNPELFVAQIEQESSWNPTIRSKAGALGLGQFMPATGKAYGLKPQDFTDPAKSLDASARYMADLKSKYNGDEDLARAAYNWGEGNIAKWQRGKLTMPKETATYNSQIYARAGLTQPTRGEATGASGKPTGQQAVENQLMTGTTLSPQQLDAIGKLAAAETTSGGVPGELLSTAAATFQGGKSTDALSMLAGLSDGKMLSPSDVRGIKLNPAGEDILASLDNMRSKAAAAQDETMAMLFGSGKAADNPLMRSMPKQVDRFLDDVLG